jgi:sec-independent protein translocase protein TatA
MIGDLFDSPWKIAIIAILIIVMFGSRKLPGAARSLGQSMRILKREVQGLHEDYESDAPAAPAAQPFQAADPAQLQATAPAPAPAVAPVPDAQAQIAALQAQLNNLQQTVTANGTAATDTQQTR